MEQNVQDNWRLKFVYSASYQLAICHLNRFRVTCLVLKIMFLLAIESLDIWSSCKSYVSLHLLLFYTNPSYLFHLLVLEWIVFLHKGSRSIMFLSRSLWSIEMEFCFFWDTNTAHWHCIMKRSPTLFKADLPHSKDNRHRETLTNGGLRRKRRACWDVWRHNIEILVYICHCMRKAEGWRYRSLIKQALSFLLQHKAPNKLLLLILPRISLFQILWMNWCLAFASLKTCVRIVLWWIFCMLFWIILAWIPVKKLLSYFEMGPYSRNSNCSCV